MKQNNDTITEKLTKHLPSTDDDGARLSSDYHQTAVEDDPSSPTQDIASKNLNAVFKNDSGRIRPIR